MTPCESRRQAKPSTTINRAKHLRLHFFHYRSPNRRRHLVTAKCLMEVKGTLKQTKKKREVKGTLEYAKQKKSQLVACPDWHKKSCIVSANSSLAVRGLECWNFLFERKHCIT